MLVEFNASSTAIDGLIVITMRQVSDERGTIRELYRASAFGGHGLGDLTFRQINVTESARGVVRGIHAERMNKLVAVAVGEAFGVYVDLRPASATYGAVVTVTLRPGTEVLVPEGVGNGFQALVDGTQYVYGFDQEWTTDMAGQACNPLDPTLGIHWPLPIDPADRAQLSAKDAEAPRFAQLTGEHHG